MSSALGTEGALLEEETYRIQRHGRRENLGSQRLSRVAGGQKCKGDTPEKKVTFNLTLHTEKSIEMTGR